MPEIIGACCLAYYLGTLLTDECRNDAVIRLTPAYKPIWVEDLQCALALNTNGGDYGGLEEIAKKFIERLIQIKALHPRETRNLVALKEAVLKDDDGRDLDSQIESVLRLLRDGGFANQAAELVNLVYRQIGHTSSDTSVPDTQDQEARALPTPPSSQASVVGAEQPLPRNMTPGEIACELRRHGSWDNESRSTLRRLTGIDKLQVLRRIHTSVLNKPATENFSNGMRIFYIQTLVPVMTCLQNHHHDDDAKFLTAWAKRKYRHNKFKNLCCGEYGSLCGLEANPETAT